MQSLQVFYRTIVMLGTLAVGALAYRAYGPELEKLEPLVDRAKQLADQAWQSNSGSDELSSDQPSDPFASLPELTDTPVPPSPALALIEDPQVQPSNWEEPASSTNSAAENFAPPEPSPVALVVRELSGLGVTKTSLTKWGESGDFYRFHCSLPWTTHHTSAQQFEAISADPVDAARQVLEKVTQWQVAHGR